MSVDDQIRETASLGIAWCPKCEPRRDPTRELLDVRWCGAHPNTPEGSADAGVDLTSYPTGSAECGGEDNRLWCAFFHGRR